MVKCSMTLNYPILGAAHSVIKVGIKFVSEHFKHMMLMKDPFEIDFCQMQKIGKYFFHIKLGLLSEQENGKYRFKYRKYRK